MEIRAPEGVRYAVHFKSAIGKSKLLNSKEVLIMVKRP